LRRRPVMGVRGQGGAASLRIPGNFIEGRPSPQGDRADLRRYAPGDFRFRLLRFIMSIRSIAR